MSTTTKFEVDGKEWVAEVNGHFLEAVEDDYDDVMDLFLDVFIPPTKLNKVAAFLRYLFCGGMKARDLEPPTLKEIKLWLFDYGMAAALKEVEHLLAPLTKGLDVEEEGGNESDPKAESPSEVTPPTTSQ